MIMQVVTKALEVPVIFEWQQKLCNNYGNVREEFADFLNRDGLEILDVGCSTGTCGGSIIDMSRNSYTGIDVVPAYVERAQKRYPKGRFLTMDARAMTFPDRTFDVVMFNGVMHHMDDDLIRDCLKDCRRVLKDNGVLLISEPVFTPEWPLSMFFLKRDRGHFIREPEGYRALLGDFRIVRERFFRFSLHRFCSFVLAKPTS